MTSDPIHARLTRTSSDLRTLSAVLLPPSPILKAEGSLVYATSGEIPVLLEETRRVCDSPPPFRVSLELWSLGGEITDKAETIASARNPTSSDGSISTSWTGIQSSDARVVAEPSSRRHVETSNDSFLAWSVSRVLKIAPPYAYYDFLGGDSGHSNTQDGCSPRTLESRGDSKGLRGLQATCSHATASSSTVAKEDHDGDQHQIISAFNTYSTLPTPTFAPPSPSSSTDVISPLSSPTNRQRYRRPLERARAVRLPSRPRSPRLQANEIDRVVRNASPPTKHACPRRQLADTTPIASTSSGAAHTAHPFTKHVAFPEELSWLKHLIIEVWFDQEGFRAARSCMQLIGYSPRARSLYPYDSAGNVGSDVTAGVAEFMPTKREAFAYHHAALDSPPTLRMVSVAGDESRDYISRQATLSVKVNGVYTVLGTETPIASMLTSGGQESRLHNVRLRWKLDYLVSDRRVDGTGKTLPGEKSLTPLTFSCSPYLFHPLQGKKTGLMHIMKKNLVSKLGSHKVEPPTYTPSRGPPPRTSHHVSTGRDVGTHARSHSDALAKGSHYLLTRSPPLDTGAAGRNVQMDHARVRRRRASSAGENSLIRL